MSKFRPNNNNNNNGSQPQQQRVPIATTGPSYMVQQMAAQNFAMRNGGQLPTTMAGSPNGNAPAVAAAPMNMNFFQQNGGATGKYEAPVVQQEPDLTPSTPAPAPEYGTDGVQFANPSQPQQNDMDSLSAALNGAGVSHPQQQVPEFHADPSQRDGGFFGWLSGLIPKNRPGMREGETPDEYDRRITTNRERIAAFADAIRHMANIVNTAKGAPLQQFNDPTAMLEQGYQNRKAQRAQKAAADANAAYKMANMTLKERAAEAADAYKRISLGYKESADRRERDKFNYQMAKDAAAAQRQAEQDKQKQSNWENQFRFRQQQAAISNGLRQQSIDKRGSGKSGGGGRGGSGSGNSYPLYNPVTGQTEHFKNEKSWIARANELGYKTDTPSSSTTSQEVYSKDGVKKVSNTTRGNSVAAQIGKQMAQKKAAARNKPKSTQKSGGSGKGHNALNAWFKKNNK